MQDASDCIISRSNYNPCRKPFDDVGFVQRYINGEAHILIVLRDGNGREYIACLQREFGVIGAGCAPAKFARWHSGVEPSVLSRESLFFAWSEAAAIVTRRHCQQESVLVYDVESVDLPQDGIPTLVRLEPIYRFLGILVHAFYLSRSALMVQLGSIEDWEACLGCGLFPVSND